MLRIYEEAKKFDYYATRFRMMLEKHGGVETARRLLAASNAQEGLTTLWEHDRSDLAVESLVLQPRFRELFDANIHSEAATRLHALGYSVDDDGHLRSSDGH